MYCYEGHRRNGDKSELIKTIQATSYTTNKVCYIRLRYNHGVVSRENMALSFSIKKMVVPIEDHVAQIQQNPFENQPKVANNVH